MQKFNLWFFFFCSFCFWPDDIDSALRYHYCYYCYYKNTYRHRHRHHHHHQSSSSVIIDISINTLSITIIFPHHQIIFIIKYHHHHYCHHHQSSSSPLSILSRLLPLNMQSSLQSFAIAEVNRKIGRLFPWAFSFYIEGFSKCVNESNFLSCRYLEVTLICTCSYC